MRCYDLTRAQIKDANRVNPVVTTRAELEEALRSLGVRAGVKMVVHTSLGSLGTFEGGAENYCRLLCELVTAEGLLMMPGLVRYPKDGEEYHFDPRTTPVGVGKAPETFRQMPGVWRSLDPTHSFCAWGKNAPDYLRNHHQYPTMHRESPLARLEAAGGCALMVGCREAVTFMHVVETACGGQCLGSRTEQYPATLPDGREVILRGWGWRNGPCRALRHDEIFDDMREKGTLAECMLHRSHLMFFPLAAYREAYARLLSAPENGCAGCPVRPRVVKQSVPSDWDFEHDRLKASEAFTGDCESWCNR